MNECEFGTENSTPSQFAFVSPDSVSHHLQALGRSLCLGFSIVKMLAIILTLYDC